MKYQWAMRADGMGTWLFHSHRETMISMEDRNPWWPVVVLDWKACKFRCALCHDAPPEHLVVGLKLLYMEFNPDD
jgi:hypothetical protein